MDKILIALDYGLSAQLIAEKGFELAQRMNAKVTLLHVVADDSYYNSIDSEPFMGFYGYDFFNIDNNESLIESSLNFLNKIKDRIKNADVEVVAEQGEFSTIILETAKKLHSDLIVLGSHSHNWLERAVMGSVTESVLKNVKIPLLIIPIKN
jgi:nucleotide-binding universal stress UspA family protein